MVKVDYWSIWGIYLALNLVFDTQPEFFAHLHQFERMNVDVLNWKEIISLSRCWPSIRIRMRSRPKSTEIWGFIQDGHRGLPNLTHWGVNEGDTRLQNSWKKFTGQINSSKFLYRITLNTPNQVWRLNEYVNSIFSLEKIVIFNFFSRCFCLFPIETLAHYPKNYRKW